MDQQACPNFQVSDFSERFARCLLVPGTFFTRDSNKIPCFSCLSTWVDGAPPEQPPHHVDDPGASRVEDCFHLGTVIQRNGCPACRKMWRYQCEHPVAEIAHAIGNDPVTIVPANCEVCRHYEPESQVDESIDSF